MGKSSEALMKVKGKLLLLATREYDLEEDFVSQIEEVDYDKP